MSSCIPTCVRVLLLIPERKKKKSRRKGFGLVKTNSTPKYNYHMSPIHLNYRNEHQNTNNLYVKNKIGIFILHCILGQTS